MIVFPYNSAFLTAVIKSGVFFVLAIPLIIGPQTTFPFVVVKDVYFRIAVEVMLVTWVLLLLWQRRLRLSLKNTSPLLWLAVTFFGLSALASLFGISPARSFWGDYQRMSGLFHLLHLVVFLVMLVSVFREKSSWHQFFTFSIFVSFLVTFIGFSQWRGLSELIALPGVDRLSSTVGNPAFFAAYLFFNIFFLLYFLADPRRFDLKLFIVSLLTLDVFLVASSLLYWLFPTADWGIFSLFKIPVLIWLVQLPVLFGVFLVFQAFFIAAYQWMHLVAMRWIALLAVLLFEIFIFLNTQTRGAILALGAALFLLAFVSTWARTKKYIKVASALTVVLLVGSVAIFFMVRNAAWVQEIDVLRRLARISLNDVTTQARLVTWQASWQGWTENAKTFLIGYGPENYYYPFSRHFPIALYQDTGSQIWFDKAHNLIFDIGVTTGVLGLGVFLAMIGFASWQCISYYRRGEAVNASLLWVALLIGYVIQNMFIFDAINAEIVLYLVLGFCAVLPRLARQFSEQPVLEESVAQARRLIIATPLLTGALVLLIFGVHVKILRANAALAAASTTPGVEYDQAKADLFMQALQGTQTGLFEARSLFADYAGSVAQMRPDPGSISAAMVERSARELEKSVAEEPHNVRHRLDLATLYNNMVFLDRKYPRLAVETLEPWLDEFSAIPNLYFTVGQSYLFLNDVEKGTDYFLQGLNLAPWVIDFHWNVMMLYITIGDFDKADQKWEDIVALQTAKNADWIYTNVNHKRQVAEAYEKVGNWRKAIEFRENVAVLADMLDRYPALDQYLPTSDDYAKLAALYAKVGENQKAAEAVQKAVALDPTLASEAQLFLEKLNAGELRE